MPLHGPTHKETLLDIEQNDNTLTGLSLGDGRAGCRYFDSRDHYSRLGNSIGANIHLTLLVISMRVGIELDVTHTEFFEGLTQNNSIEKLQLWCDNRNISGGITDKILKAYQTNSNNLVDLFIITCRLQYGGDRILAATLRSCTNLTKLTLQSCDISDEQLLVLVDAIRGNYLLENFDLGGNRIGDAGCETLSTLLNNPQSNLQVLGLNNNDFRNEGAIAIIKSLACNNKLRELYLIHNAIDRNVEDAFSQLLCNTSSINQTYSSNHTLNSLTPHPIDNHLNYLLKQNKGTNKTYVAMRKILRYHPKLDMEPFFGWDAEGELTLKGLPYVLAWFERARRAVIVNEEGYEDDTDGEKECNVENRKLLAIYEFAKAMPLRFVTSRTKVGDREDSLS